MPTRIAISGFGRIGRLCLRAVIEEGRDDLEVVAVNSRGPLATAAHLFRYDSAHGRFRHDVKLGEDSLDIGRGPIAYLRETDPTKLPWGDMDIDVVLECTGKFTDRDDAGLHLKAGAKRVLVSAPSKGADATIVHGVNGDALTPESRIVSSASCTTNCLAPIAKVLNDLCGIDEGFMTTVHSYTHDQPTLDSTHKDLYRARSAAVSLIPTKTGAASALGLVLPELDGKLDGAAIRVPTQNVSAVDLTARTSKPVTVQQIHEAMRVAANGPMKGVLGYTDEKLVSVDFNHDSRSSVYHADQTRVLGDRFVRVLAWYDNEWGFANRMLDVAASMGALEPARETA